MANDMQPAAQGSDLILVYTTFPDAAAALSVGRALVEERIAGCINVLPAMTSVYVWEGKTETASEAVLIAKTRAALTAEVVAAIKARHSYEVPAILVLPVAGGNADYAAFIAAGTKTGSGETG